MKGILLLNLGTPVAPTRQAVAKFLREFLMDPFVLDINPMARWFLVHGIIAPFRAKKSATAYQKIWTKAGSPLMVHTQNLQNALQKELGPEFLVAIGMRYGEPSVEHAYQTLVKKGVQEILAIPLYPQFADSSTRTVLEDLFKVHRNYSKKISLTHIAEFYHEAGFLKAFASLGRGWMTNFKPDHILFSFHSIPERQLKKQIIAGKVCRNDGQCCEPLEVNNKDCYRAQCFYTARALAKELQLLSDQYSISFQSRLGRIPWAQPYTDKTIIQLAGGGKKRLLVFCPSFVTDCLETLEEIALRGRDSFLEHGGEDLALVPSLNDHPDWVQALANIILQSTQNPLEY
ncbi:MAG: ferrochelatase [Deltaproteobacteria bacterium]|nr:ferrochelatase [Deltaproteobacteria bacterium]